MTDGRVMISFGSDAMRFQLRAAAIIRRDGHVLIHRATTEEIWSLPGGRVKIGETGSEALERELLEELGVAAIVGPPAFVIENLFRYDGRAVHEVAFYYPVEIPQDFPFITDTPCHRVEDGGSTLEFMWARNDTQTLSAAMPLYPAELRGRMDQLDPHLVHLVVDEL